MTALSFYHLQKCRVVARKGTVTIHESILLPARNRYDARVPCTWYEMYTNSLQWCHNERDGVSNHQPHDYLLNRLFRRRSKKTLKLRVTGLCAGKSPVTGEFPAQRASNAENVFHLMTSSCSFTFKWQILASTSWRQVLIAIIAINQCKILFLDHWNRHRENCLPFIGLKMHFDNNI